MASVSHTASGALPCAASPAGASSTSTGTLPAGAITASARLNAEPGTKSRRSLTSSKAMPAWCIASHGLSDHDE